MPKAGYTLNSGSVAMTPATPKTVIMVIAPATFGIDLKSFDVSFDGVTAANTPALIELVSSTQAGAGTPGSSPTPLQGYGRAIAVGFTSGVAYSAEPTVLTVLESWTESPNAGLVMKDLALPYDQDVSKGLGFRITAPQAVNCRINMTVERC